MAGQTQSGGAAIPALRVADPRCGGNPQPCPAFKRVKILFDNTGIHSIITIRLVVYLIGLHLVVNQKIYDFNDQIRWFFICA
jgi:hypothetical protein